MPGCDSYTWREFEKCQVEYYALEREKRAPKIIVLLN